MKKRSKTPYFYISVYFLTLYILNSVNSYNSVNSDSKKRINKLINNK